MSKQMTEMLKGTLEGIVVAILAERPAYGYEITACGSRASPTLPKAPSTPCSSGSSSAASSTWRRSRPRRGRRARYSLNAQGRDYLEEFWRTWSFLERIEKLHEGEK